MLSKIPIDIGKIKKDDLDKEILRAAIIGELDAINLYEEFANMTENNDSKISSYGYCWRRKNTCGRITNNAPKIG